MNRDLEVCIVGLGLIGGSLGMALVRGHLVRRVVGVDISPDIVRKAKERGAIHEGSESLESVCRKADLLVLATPIGRMPELARRALPYLPEGAIITDVGSTKGFMNGAMRELLNGHGVFYVGGHPMTGSELSGIEAARPDLFRGSPYVLCPPIGEGEASSALNVMRELISGLGAEPVIMDPEEHDLICAYTSHVPHMVACALVDALRKLSVEFPEAGNLVAGGFRDVTRVASRDPIMGGDILLTNKEGLRQAIEAFRARLGELLDLVESGDARALRERLSAIKGFRENIFLRKGASRSEG